MVGSAVLNDAETKNDAFIARLDRVSSGVMAAANLPTLLVQCVSMLEGRDENPAFQDYAAQVAARFLLSLLDEISV